MEELDQAVVVYLRNLARDGASASRLLQSLQQRLEIQEPHKLTLLKYMRAAFGLTLQEASPIAGWSACNEGELSNEQIDALIDPEIVRHGPDWQRMQAV